MDDAIQRSVVTAATAAILGLLGAWVGRARLRQVASGDAAVLQHPTSSRILALMGTAFTLVPGLAAMFAVKTVGRGLPVLMLGLSVLMLLFLLETRVSHRLLTGGMRYGALFGEGGELLWIDVKRLRYSRSMKWFVIELPHRTKVRVSVWLTSLPAFAAAVLEQVPPATIDHATRLVLEEMAAGSPPSIWES